ncbi:MAG: hypothetical protein JNK82_19645 [Myxococcaceae bacterium]|nr:hypothetical protein [Myxococcaceae bacterium]
MTTRLAAVVLCLCFVAACKKSDPPQTEPAAKGEQKQESRSKGTSVKLTLAAPKVGAKYSVKNDTLVSMTALGAEMSSNETRAYDVEVVEVDEDAPVKANVKYTAAKTVEVEEGKPVPPTESPLLGKSYVVSLQGEEVVATDAKGVKVSEEELALIRDDIDFLGKPDAVRVELAAREFKVGEAAPGLADALTKEIADGAAESGEESDIKFSEVKVVLSEDKGTHAVFTVTLKMDQKVEEAPMSAKLSGTVEARKSDAEITKLELSGPLELGGGLASGKMSIASVRTE